MIKSIFILLLLVCFCDSSAQYNQLILRKNGKAYKRYTEGSVITIQSKLGVKYSGTIYLIQNDSIYFKEDGIRVSDIAVVFKQAKRKSRLIPMSNEEFLYANLGIPLFAIILTLGGEPFVYSLAFGASLVYGPVLLYNLQRIIFKGKNKFVIGDRYDLLLLDLYKAEKLPEKK
jgi:hypothetical protein